MSIFKAQKKCRVKEPLVLNADYTICIFTMYIGRTRVEICTCICTIAIELSSARLLNWRKLPKYPHSRVLTHRIDIAGRSYEYRNIVSIWLHTGQKGRVDLHLIELSKKAVFIQTAKCVADFLYPLPVHVLFIFPLWCELFACSKPRATNYFFRLQTGLVLRKIPNVLSIILRKWNYALSLPPSETTNVRRQIILG